MIIELYQYRARHNTTWQTVAQDWWSALFKTESPVPGTIQSSWSSVSKKRQQLRKEALCDFLIQPYVEPCQNPVHIEAEDVPEAEDQSGDESDMENCDDIISPATVCTLAESLEGIVDLLYDETLSHQQTIAEHKDTQKELTHLTDALELANQINREMQQELASLEKRNLARKLHRREDELKVQARANQKLSEKVQLLEEKVKALQKEKKGKGDSRRYFMVTSDKMKSSKTDLKKQVRQLELENEDLRCQLDDIMNNREVLSFENGKYTSDIRLTCYELLARGVSSRNVGDIIRIVLRDVGKMSVTRLPKPTLIRYLAVEQAMLNKEAARNKMATSDNPLTLHVDGTSKKRKGYTTFLASTDSGTVGMCLHDISSESADTLLQETEETLNELVSLNLTADHNQAWTLLSKIKNTMTDRCVVNKCYVQKLEKFRASILPKVTENWADIDEETKQHLATINDLYCGKHLVLNLQEYASAALIEWEKIESCNGKLGREKKLLWTRQKGESASLLAVRSFCNLLGPDCDQQSGMVEEFKAIVPSSQLMAYRGNRFHVPFHNSAAVIYHTEHFHELCASLDPKREGNMFIKCLKEDLKDDVIVAGIRAMGIIGQHISLPVMKMVESDIHVMDTDVYYTRLHSKIGQWMNDPTPLLNDSCLLFKEFPPKRNEMHRALYQTTTEDVEHLTKQALSIVLHNMFVCISRQLEDHLPGGRFHNADAQLRTDTSTCPKDNLSAERMFAGLDYLRRKMPNANTVSFEGILLWTLNKTRHYLDTMDPAEREKFISSARRKRASYLKLYQSKSAALKKQTAERLQESRERKEAKQRSLTKMAAENTRNAISFCGMICSTTTDVDKMMEKLNPKDVEQGLHVQLKHWKTTSKGGIPKDLFYLTKAGKKLSIDDLAANLKKVIHQVMETQDIEPQPGTSQHCDKEKLRDELKQKYLAKMSPTKRRRKGPFPSDRIIQRRILHTFLEPGSDQMVEYKGLVIREATEDDLEQLVERQDKKLIQQYKFYTLAYDPPYEDMYCYPLEKEWEDGCLELI